MPATETVSIIFDVFAEMDDYLVIDKPGGVTYTVGVIEEEMNGSLVAICSCEECRVGGFKTVEDLVRNIMYVGDHIEKRAEPRSLRYPAN